MKLLSSRRLTDAERAALSEGLPAALDLAGCQPRIIARPSMFALVAALWRGRPPIMVLGRKIYWPGALDDFSSQASPRLMSTLQHELHHVLEFATGELTRAGYVVRPSNWIYRYELGPGARWRNFGAEQRAQMAGDLWLAEHNENDPAKAQSLRSIIPWARPNMLDPAALPE
jgi:hypothetical protein